VDSLIDTWSSDDKDVLISLEIMIDVTAAFKILLLHLVTLNRCSHCTFKTLFFAA
jgi:hypothetical protein